MLTASATSAGAVKALLDGRIRPWRQFGLGATYESSTIGRRDSIRCDLALAPLVDEGSRAF
jgi:hypothetical protein